MPNTFFNVGSHHSNQFQIKMIRSNNIGNIFMSAYLYKKSHSLGHIFKKHALEWIFALVCRKIFRKKLQFIFLSTKMHNCEIPLNFYAYANQLTQNRICGCCVFPFIDKLVFHRAHTHKLAVWFIELQCIVCINPHTRRKEKSKWIEWKIEQKHIQMVENYIKSNQTQTFSMRFNTKVKCILAD